MYRWCHKIVHLLSFAIFESPLLKRLPLLKHNCTAQCIVLLIFVMTSRSNFTPIIATCFRLRLYISLVKTERYLFDGNYAANAYCNFLSNNHLPWKNNQNFLVLLLTYTLLKRPVHNCFEFHDSLRTVENIFISQGKLCVGDFVV